MGLIGLMGPLLNGGATMRNIVIKTAYFKLDKRGRPKVAGYVRWLPASDPRSLDHPSHKEQWLELARAIGRQMANDEFEAMLAARRKSE
jgi:hypothetical protein